MYETVNNLLQSGMLTELLKIMCIPTVYGAAKLATHSYKLHKNSKYDNSYAILPTDIIQEHSKIDKAALLKHEISDSINNFASTITNNISKENLALFYNNINSLTTSSYIFKHKVFQVPAYYALDDNSIRYPKYGYQSLIDHELLHMASSYRDNTKKIMYTGFMQLKGEI